jgi:hypothetical protein
MNEDKATEQQATRKQKERKSERKRERERERERERKKREDRNSGGVFTFFKDLGSRVAALCSSCANMDDSTSHVELLSNPETNAAVAAAAAPPPLQQTSQNPPALFSVPGE